MQRHKQLTYVRVQVGTELRPYGITMKRIPIYGYRIR